MRQSILDALICQNAAVVERGVFRFEERDAHETRMGIKEVMFGFVEDSTEGEEKKKPLWTSKRFKEFTVGEIQQVSACSGNRMRLFVDVVEAVDTVTGEEVEL